jgi:hypothetical protein
MAAISLCGGALGGRAMFKQILVASWVIILTTGAFTQPLSDAETRAVNELSGEMLECSVYFLVSATCLEGNPDPRIPQMIKNLNEQASKIGQLAITTGRIVGVTDEAVGARMKLMRDDLLKRLNNNCTNIATLLEKYTNFCKALTENADPRLAELLRGQKCTGSYKC